MRNTFRNRVKIDRTHQFSEDKPCWRWERHALAPLLIVEGCQRRLIQGPETRLTRQ